MKESVDCLFIGHNEMEFDNYVKLVRSMGNNSGAYRDLNLNFIIHNNKNSTPFDIYNLLKNQDEEKEKVSLLQGVSLTITYLGTFLKNKGFSIDYVNSFQDEKEELVEKLKNNNILTVIIPTTLYVAPFPIIEIIECVKKYNSNAKIILGGPYISREIKCSESTELLISFFEYLNADVYINSAQGETALSEAIKAIKEERELKSIDNICYKNGNEYIINSISEENNSLDENMVDWNLFSDKLGKCVRVRTSISCPFSCAFCGFPQHAGKYRLANIKTIEKELNMINSIRTIESVQFIDDTFNVPKERFKELLRMMIKNKYKFKWHSHFRCQFSDEETIKLMKEAGCEGVFLGIESGSQIILNNMNKQVTLDKYRKGIELLNKYEIVNYASFIIGYPGETKETIQETVNFIEETKPTFFRTQLWYCDTVTPIWTQKDKYKIEGSNFQWSHSTMNYLEACDAIEKIFFTIKNSIWVPQYNFEFEAIFSLLHEGMSIEQVKDFINSFDEGVREKLQNNDQYEISDYILTRLRNACGNKCENQELLNKYNAEFTF